MKDKMTKIDNQIHQLLDENKDLVELQHEKALLLPKYCWACNKDLEDYKEGLGAKIKKGEYLIMMSVLENNIGAEEYTCFECLDHMHKYHMVATPYMAFTASKDLFKDKYTKVINPNMKERHIHRDSLIGRQAIGCCEDKTLKKKLKKLGVVNALIDLTGKGI
jgi:hypothetical protein